MKKLFFTTLISFALGVYTLEARNAQNYYLYNTTTSILDKRAIVEIAKREKRRLFLQKKIPQSWKSSSFLNIEKLDDNSNWIVSFSNLKIKHVKYQTLYIGVDTKGNIMSSSYKRLVYKKN